MASRRKRPVVYIRQLGANIRVLRELKGLKHSELALKAGVDRTYLYELEGSDHVNPTLDTLLRLQGALGLASLELLLEGLPNFASVREQIEEGSSEAGTLTG
jgi:transcriptional regulator with XRE-family HTH domain